MILPLSRRHYWRLWLTVDIYGRPPQHWWTKRNIKTQAHIHAQWWIIVARIPTKWRSETTNPEHRNVLVSCEVFDFCDFCDVEGRQIQRRQLTVLRLHRADWWLPIGRRRRRQWSRTWSECVADGDERQRGGWTTAEYQLQRRRRRHRRHVDDVIVLAAELLITCHRTWSLYYTDTDCHKGDTEVSCLRFEHITRRWRPRVICENRGATDLSIIPKTAIH